MQYNLSHNKEDGLINQELIRLLENRKVTQADFDQAFRDAFNFVASLGLNVVKNHNIRQYPIGKGEHKGKYGYICEDNLFYLAKMYVFSEQVLFRYNRELQRVSFRWIKPKPRI